MSSQRAYSRKKSRPRLELLEDRTALSGNSIISDPSPDPNNASMLIGVSSGVLNGNGQTNYVIFTSASPNVPNLSGLIKNDTQGFASADVFLLNRSNNTVTLVSHAPNSSLQTGNDGTPAFDDSQTVSTYGNGKIAFVSFASNLVSGESGPTGNQNIYLFDVASGQITLVSHAASATQRANGNSSRLALSRNGLELAFVSNSTDLPGISGGTPGQDNVFVYHTQTGAITLVSHVAANATTGGNGSADSLAISDNGAVITYESSASNLVGVAGLPANNVYSYSQGTNTLVNHAATSVSAPANASAFAPVISGDGNWISYTSAATNLVPGQVASPFTSVFLYDRVGGANSLVSGKAGSSTAPSTGDSDSPSISADGSVIAYVSNATNIVAGETIGNLTPQSDVYYFDRASGLSSLVSSKAGVPKQTADGFTTDVDPPISQGLPFDPRSANPSVSPDGRYVAFVSSAKNLVSNQSLGTFDDQSGSGPMSIIAGNVFRWDSHTATNRLVSGLNNSLTVTGVFEANRFVDVENDGEVFYNRVVPPNATTLNGATGALLNPFPSVTLIFQNGSRIVSIPDGSPAQTIASMLNAVVANPLSGQFSPPVSVLTPGFGASGSFFLTELAAVSGNLITENLRTVFTANFASQSTYQVQVSIDLGYISDRQTFTVNVTPSDPAISAYVIRVFQDLLHRNITLDPAGLAYWKFQLGNGLSRIAFAKTLTHAPEYFDTVINPAYATFLGRVADPAGLAFWEGQLAAGLTDEQLEAQFIATSEYYAHEGGTDKTWIDGIYKELFNRLPDSAGETFWIEAAKRSSRFAVALGFAKSQEREILLVEADYTTYLRRGSDPEGLQFWVNQFLSNSSTNEDLIAGFLSSSEYFNRRP